MPKSGGDPTVRKFDASQLPDLPGMDRERLERDLAHPKAAASMARLFSLEKASTLRSGDPAPDFELPRLGGSRAGEPVRLSDHFRSGGAARPVALVFGSYT